jgi:C-terminal processing protease CtpA/Prc
VQITRPQRGYFGPLVVMENECSTSDAEVFPEGIRTLTLGKVVGVTTYGAVIGTGAYRLRTPGSGLWNVNARTSRTTASRPTSMSTTHPRTSSRAATRRSKAVEVLKEKLGKR